MRHHKSKKDRRLERYHEPVLSTREFVWRVMRYSFFALLFVGLALLMGVVGYHHFEGISWVDSLLNASMILGGMGPVTELHHDSAKLFASFYALFSGLAFVGACGIGLTPFVHRFLHRLHLPTDDDGK